MKMQGGARRSCKHPWVRFRGDNEPQEKQINDLANAGTLFVLLGFFALVLPLLTARNHTLQLIPLWQPMQETRAEAPTSRTISPATAEGAILVGFILVGLGSW